MRFENVCIESFTHSLPPHVVTSDEIENQLAPVYDRLNLPAGRLELMTGIRERRFYKRGTLPGAISAETAKLAIARSGIDPADFGALIHASVCRDQLEPATACGIHHATGLPNAAVVLDASNACLGLLNGMLLIAGMIELGQIRAGIVVGTETGRGLVEGTIDSLNKDPHVSRRDVKLAFASLTIGSGSAAVVLCHRNISQTQHRLLGGACLADTSHHELCAGGVESEIHGDDRPRMQTDSEALLHAGVALAQQTWQATREELGWSNDDVNCIFTHQVGRAHRKLLLDQLELDPNLDHPTVEFLGNTGAVALPTATSIGFENGVVNPGDRIAMLGIGSGLNSVMLGIEASQRTI